MSFTAVLNFSVSKIDYKLLEGKDHAFHIFWILPGAKYGASYIANIYKYWSAEGSKRGFDKQQKAVPETQGRRLVDVWCCGKQPACQSRRRGFDPGLMLWSKKWQLLQ